MIAAVPVSQIDTGSTLQGTGFGGLCDSRGRHRCSEWGTSPPCPHPCSWWGERFASVQGDGNRRGGGKGMGELREMSKKGNYKQD